MAAPDDLAETPPPPSVRTRLSAEEVADYLVEIGASLASYNCPAYRLEDVVRAVAEAEGYTAETFAMPTGFFVSVRSPRHPTPIQRMARVVDRGVNLGRLADVDAIFNDVADKRVTIAEGRARLRTLEQTPSGYERWHKWLAIAAVSGAAGVFFGGGWREVVAGSIAGLAINGLGASFGLTPVHIEGIIASANSNAPGSRCWEHISSRNWTRTRWR